MQPAIDQLAESTEAWRAVLDDLIRRGLRRPEFLIVDGAAGLDKAIAAVWDGVPMQRCTVHKHRNLLAHAPERLHEEITSDLRRDNQGGSGASNRMRGFRRACDGGRA